MRATAWRSGDSKYSTYGIRIGFVNRDQYFEKGWTNINVEIDGKSYVFELTPGFWNMCPEFRDRRSPVIREWLRSHFTINWPRGKPPRFSLLPLGGHHFRLVTN